MTKTALIAGGGIAGTVAAIALHRAGWAPRIFEAYPEDADQRGAFLTVAVNGLSALRVLGLDPARVLAAGYPTPTLTLGNGAGRRLALLPLGGPTADGTTTTTIRRADLYAALRSAATGYGIPIEYDKRLTGVDERPDGVTVTFADGSRADGDLLVGADGLRSRTREALSPGGPAPAYLGLLNAGGFTSVPVEADLDRTPGMLHMAFGRRAFFGWSVAPDSSVWWFANPPRKQPVRPGEFTPSTWRAHLLELFADDAIPAAAIIRASDEALGPWNTYDLPRVPVWRTGRCVLVGDAAHAVSPSSGQGASMAIEDAVTLGRCLGADDGAAAASDPATASRPATAATANPATGPANPSTGPASESAPATAPTTAPTTATALAAGLAAYEQRRRARVEKVVAYGRRSGSSKTAGPVGAAIRDALTPLIMKMIYRRGNPQAWILEHRV